ncbi:hypothetical protein IW492_06270 [Enterococcus sp. BWB1-3]|uniref:hypothetical protein n=1 Tax=unclassified Enterococcus TaxID=2608891 RepID=UPI0019246848|nr:MULTISPECIES: hypothetical protein [unclassified Enterococcus]MBL1228838.1 hypothetical protein [Enterococcus sp. BWB1-3]MCB5951620.1 hypothetical protein [Enterococcus sp. BWT-B8]MCB5954712.1 hypothetical protein [Enterococcus sp. CWB-B31]
MLIVIDARNCNLDLAGKKYAAPNEAFIKRLKLKIHESINKESPVLYTRDISVEQKREK